MGEDIEDMLCISCKALCRAQRTISDFAKTYLPFHGLQPEAFLDHWDLLVFTEAVIYQKDEENEMLASKGDAQASLQGLELVHEVLRRRGLMTAALLGELQEGEKYWARERNIAACMYRYPIVPPGGHIIGFSLEDVHACSATKSFDYRVLNLLMYSILGTQPDANLLAFLRADETLLDLGDDMTDYEDDVCGNSFNIYRSYIHLYGEGAQLKLVAYISELEEQHSQLLSRLPAETQAFYHKRKLDAVQGPTALRWVLPTPIYDEAKFRQEFAS